MDAANVDEALGAGGAPVLEVLGISKSFGPVQVLDDISMSVRAGTVTALLGENGAGKSTLTRIIAGDHKPDGGVVRIGEVESAGLDPIAANRLGVRMVYQEFNDAPSLSVVENIMLGKLPRSRTGLVDWRRAEREARQALEVLDVDVDVRAPVSSLSVGKRQSVEIARAITDSAKVLILDEPTAALSDAEVRALFRLIARLKSQGIAIVYITHRLDEVQEIADEVVVMRDGLVVGTGAVAGFSRARIVELMLGHRPPERERDRSDFSAAPKVLELEVAGRLGEFADISLTVHEQEVLVIYGKLGAGANELAESLFGVRSLDSGTLRLRGEEYRLTSPRAAAALGIGFLPADRKREAALLERSAAENMAAASWSRVASRGMVTNAMEAKVYNRWRDRLRIRAAGPNQTLGTLSGGNQQKALLGRWLERGCRLLVLVEPTRGVDIAGREEIHAIVREVAREGAAVVVVTSDSDEAQNVGDRALVMARGRIVRELREDMSVSSLTEAAG
jgi:ribose transport system ATP-binding protein